MSKTAPLGGVVLLHGHRSMPGSMWRMARALRHVGYATLVARYPSDRANLSEIVDRLAPQIERFERSTPGPLHFVGHSLGGLVIRLHLARRRPAHLGRVVMIGTPNGGSEWADLIAKARLAPLLLGPVGRHLTTSRRVDDEAALGTTDYPVGVIAGDTRFRRFVPPLLPRPNDGTVAVASTAIAGMADHIVLPVTHAVLPLNTSVIRQTLAFLHDGAFLH